MPLTLTRTEARRLAVTSQLLAGKRPPRTRYGILETIRALRHLQLDPTAAVAPSHLLVLWSRLGHYNPADLDALVRKGHLFEYRAFLYPTEEYPVHASRMRHFGRWLQGEGIWPSRLRDFMQKNRDLRRQILTRALAVLVREGRADPVEVRDGVRTLAGRWYVSSDALALLERLRKGAWRPRTTLLSPFDTLINDREKTEELFGFRFRLEIYVPKGKRQYGYFVMPILHEDRLIGRVSPATLRDQGRLAVEAIYAEPDAPADHATGRAVAKAIEELAVFLGAREITYGRTLPSAWKPALRS